MIIQELNDAECAGCNLIGAEFSAADLAGIDFGVLRPDIGKNLFKVADRPRSAKPKIPSIVKPRKPRVIVPATPKPVVAAPPTVAVKSTLPVAVKPAVIKLTKTGQPAIQAPKPSVILPAVPKGLPKLPFAPKPDTFSPAQPKVEPEKAEVKPVKMVLTNEQVKDLPWLEQTIVTAHNNVVPDIKVTDKAVAVVQALPKELTDKIKEVVDGGFIGGKVGDKAKQVRADAMNKLAIVGKLKRDAQTQDPTSAAKTNAVANSVLGRTLIDQARIERFRYGSVLKTYSILKAFEERMYLDMAAKATDNCHKQAYMQESSNARKLKEMAEAAFKALMTSSMDVPGLASMIDTLQGQTSTRQNIVNRMDIKKYVPQIKPPMRTGVAVKVDSPVPMVPWMPQEEEENVYRVFPQAFGDLGFGVSSVTNTVSDLYNTGKEKVKQEVGDAVKNVPIPGTGKTVGDAVDAASTTIAIVGGVTGKTKPRIVAKVSNPRVIRITGVEWQIRPGNIFVPKIYIDTDLKQIEWIVQNKQTILLVDHIAEASIVSIQQEGDKQFVILEPKGAWGITNFTTKLGIIGTGSIPKPSDWDWAPTRVGGGGAHVAIAEPRKELVSKGEELPPESEAKAGMSTTTMVAIGAGVAGLAVTGIMLSRR